MSAPSDLPLKVSGELLGGHLARDIVTPIEAASSDGVVRTAVHGLITFGLIPAVLWPLRFGRLIQVERQHLAALTGWLRTTDANQNLAELDRSLKAIHFRPMLYLIAVACCAFLLLMFTSFAAHFGSGSELLWRSTYFFRHAAPEWSDRAGAVARFTHRLSRSDYGDAETTLLFGVWTAGLSLAYLAHWVQVQLHARSVRRFLNSFSRIAMHEGLAPVFLQPIGAGVRPLWVLGAIGMIACNAPWGIPLMLAGAVHSRYATSAGPLMRRTLAARLNEWHLLCRPREAASVATTRWVSSRDRCVTAGCRFPVPAGARFCPRCGRRSAGPIDRVA